jgi:peptide-methionine (S)-S-oxide reductase
MNLLNKKRYQKIIALLVFVSFIYINIAGTQKTTKMSQSKNLQTATFGGGCFWCIEAIFQELEGVVSVEAGYAGGRVKSPTYEDVCTGSTGHAEVIQIKYDPSKVAYELLLDVFFNTHNPTTLNRQGADRGTQYRSVIFYHTPIQKTKAEQIINELTEAQVFDAPIVTEIVPITNYYKAENYHQNYYENNPSKAYCNVVINPKLTKFMKQYKDKLKKKK